MRDRRVAGHGFHLMDGGAMRSADQRGLDPAMLVAERDLEMQHLLAGALETEMAGLDDARVHGTDGDFVHFPAIHPKELAVDRSAVADPVAPA